MSERNIVVSIFIVLASLIMSLHVYAVAPVNITVSAAMSLKASFEEIGRAFMRENSDIKVVFNFNSSGRLRQQIENGAPVDIFASASMKEMDRLVDKGLVDEKTKGVFAGNRIVLIVPVKAEEAPRSFNDLKRDVVKRIVIGNPDTTPVGMYSREVLRNLDVWDGVKGKSVYAEHVRQILDYVARNEVDTGLVYATDARIRKAEIDVSLFAPEGSHRRIEYPIAMLKDAGSTEASERFIAFVLSEEGRMILKKYGFVTPQ